MYIYLIAVDDDVFSYVFRYFDFYYDEWEKGKQVVQVKFYLFFKKSDCVHSNVLRNKLCHFDVDRTSIPSTFKSSITYY